jgi:hypothetical protein
MSTARPRISLADVAEQVIHQQIRPPLAATRSRAIAQQPNWQGLLHAFMPNGTRKKNRARILVDLILSFLLLAVSAIHIYHGALLFHRVVVNLDVKPGRACASSSFLVNHSAMGVIDPKFCPNLRLAQPAVSCSDISNNVDDAKISSSLNTQNKIFFLAQGCSAMNVSNSAQCKAFLASSLSPDSSERLLSQDPTPFNFYQHLSKFCSASVAHLATSTGDTSIEITSMMSLAPSFSFPTLNFPFCSCDASWAIIALDGRGSGALTAAKFLLQEPLNDASAVEILAGAEAAAVNCRINMMSSACAFPTAVRTPQGSGCACLQWIHFESKLWWLLLLLQMTAAVAVWLREGTALLLPLLAYRNVHSVRSMNFSLPCAVAMALWEPHVLEESSSANNSASSDGFKRRWLNHFQTFTLAQHLPMFLGGFYFSRVVAMAGDQALQLSSSDVAAQAAIAGLGLR